MSREKRFWGGLIAYRLDELQHFQGSLAIDAQWRSTTYPYSRQRSALEKRRTRSHEGHSRRLRRELMLDSRS